MKRRLLLALCAVLLPLPAVAEQALGRLFFTPEKRAALERSRRLNLRQAQQMEGETLSLDGIVRRSDGSGTAWINGRPHYVADPRHGVAIGLQPGAAGATISVGDEAPSRLRVGESVNRGTRDKNDLISNGRISSRRSVPGR
ncbi:MAG: hypothetical protein IPJ21_08845 [Sterolibacteriaceae bacterium]|nr:hypothetical protein [Sterolibacteriaceae bacterium]MBK9083973.1 hypothetical protein [Sterolibacteriaceae bacterium]